MQELVIPEEEEEEEEEVLHLTKLTFDQLSLNIRQDRIKCYARNLEKSLLVTTTKENVPNTTFNPKVITSAGTAFVTTSEHNVARINKQIEKLQNGIYASDQKVTRLEQDKKWVEEEYVALSLVNSTTIKLQASIKDEAQMLSEAMEMVYEEILKYITR